MNLPATPWKYGVLLVLVGGVGGAVISFLTRLSLTSLYGEVAAVIVGYILVLVFSLTAGTVMARVRREQEKERLEAQTRRN